MISINNYEYRILNVICASPEQEEVETHAPIITKMKGAQKTNPVIKQIIAQLYNLFPIPFTNGKQRINIYQDLGYDGSNVLLIKPRV